MSGAFMEFHWRLLTGEQVRAARSLARIEQAELARRTQLSVETIKRLERIRGPVDANIRTLNAIGAAFEQIGIRFDTREGGGEGVWRIRELQAPAQRPPEPGRRAEDELHRLIYHARTGEVSARAQPATRLAQSIEVPAGLTGAGFERDGQVIQVMEGAPAAVRQMFGAIASDPRHASVTVIENRSIVGRLFARWSDCGLLSASEIDALGQEPALSGGFRAELLSPAAALGLLIQVGELRQTATGEARSGSQSATRAVPLALSA